LEEQFKRGKRDRAQCGRKVPYMKKKLVRIKETSPLRRPLRRGEKEEKTGFM
jgi:hypothetical protein